MDVLLTGNLSAITQELSKQLCIENKLVLAAKNIEEKNLHKKAISFSFAPKDEMFPKLFKSYSFGSVIFLAARGEQKNRQAGNLEELDAVLSLCSEHKVPQVIYVSSSEVYGKAQDIDETTAPEPVNKIGYMLTSAEALCKYYKKTSNLNTVILHVPYLYEDHVTDLLLPRIILQAAQKKNIELPGSPDRQCDFLKDNDLASLIRKIVEGGYKLSEGVINVGTEKPVTFSALADLIKVEFPDSKITYSADEGSVPVPVASEIPRKYYDWLPLNDFSTDFSKIAKSISEEAPQRKSIWTTVKEKAPKYKYLLQGLELVLGFVLMEFLNSVTKASVQFRFIDFRLLYVVILGAVHGMRVGIIAALLACVSCVLSYAGEGMSWQLIFYNVDHWLPFVMYIIGGAVTGYTKDKSENAQKFEREQMQSLEEHYLFLYELYDQTLKNKSQYKDQLVSYRDSFGRIYSITKKLDSIVADSVFREAINVLEDALENQTIAIYRITPDKKFGRLAVSSKGLAETAEGSIQLAQFSTMMGQLKKEEVWFNREMLEGYPVYCAPIFDQENLVALIMIKEASYEQMATYYLNLIKVLSGLVQASLVRAANYTSVIEDKIYIKGTRILKNEKFSEIFTVRRGMKESQFADFKLLRVEDSSDSKEQLSNLIDQGIRKTDVMGEGKDGVIYLILSQAKQGNLELVLKRLETLGVRCTQIEPSESVAI